MTDKNKRHFQAIQDCYWEIDEALTKLKEEMKNVLDNDYKTHLEELEEELSRTMWSKSDSFESWLVNYAMKYGLDD